MTARLAVGGIWQPPPGRRDPAGPTEAQFTAQVLELAVLRGWRAWHARDSRRQDIEAMPDIIAVRARYHSPGDIIPDTGTGRVLFAELKVPGYTTTNDQALALAELDAVGPEVEVCLWTPADWPDIERVLS